MKYSRLPFILLRLLGTPLRWLLGIFHSRIHGDARWMNRKEQRRFLNPGHRGLVFSPKHRLSLDDSFKNLALVAPTGSGKTSRYVIPNVLQVEGSVVVTDPAGEIFAQTSGHLANRGFQVQVLNPAVLDASLRFNPLVYWRTPQELRQLATILGHAGANGRSDPFWTVSAVSVLAMLLAALINVEDESYVNLANLRWLLTNLEGRESNGMHSFMSRYLEDPQAFAEYRAFCSNKDTKLTGSILASAQASLELWADPDVCRFSATNTVDLRKLRYRPTAIYLIVPEHQVRYFGLLLNLFYSACFARCLGEAGPEVLPVFFFLDEFGNLGKIENFAAMITTLRKRRCSVSIILQELSQLDAVYGRDEARTIFSGGCANKLFFSGLDLRTTEFLERSLGRNTEYDTTFGGIDERAVALRSQSASDGDSNSMARSRNATASQEQNFSKAISKIRGVARGLTEKRGMSVSRGCKLDEAISSSEGEGHSFGRNRVETQGRTEGHTWGTSYEHSRSDTETESHTETESWDRSVAQAFNLLDQVSKTYSEALQESCTETEGFALSERRDFGHAEQIGESESFGHSMGRTRRPVFYTLEEKREMVINRLQRLSDRQCFVSTEALTAQLLETPYVPDQQYAYLAQDYPKLMMEWQGYRLLETGDRASASFQVKESSPQEREDTPASQPERDDDPFLD